MSSPPRASWSIRNFVPGYLVVLGVSLLVWSYFLATYNSEEIFVAFLAGLGGLTMIVTAALVLTLGDRGSR